MKQRCRKLTATQRDPTLDRQWPRGVESSIRRQLVETDSQQIETFSAFAEGRGIFLLLPRARSEVKTGRNYENCCPVIQSVEGLVGGL